MAIPSFPQGDDIYLGEGALPQPPTFPPWPERSGLLKARGGFVITADPGNIVVAGNLNFLVPSKSFRSDMEVDAERGLGDREKKPSAQHVPSSVVKRLRSQPRPQSFETGSGFAVQGVDVRSVWVGPGNSAGPSKGGANWWHIGGLGVSRLANPSSALIEFANGLFAAVTALPGFIATIICDERGVSALIYRPIHSTSDIAESTEEAIGALESGALRADAATDFAVELRKFKHVDPVLGVISAYLYESIGDIESVRRMAYFYVWNQQPIPYDIVLLADIKVTQKDGLLWARVPAVPKRAPRTKAERPHRWAYSATPATEGVVGGFWPWMRQGWTFLDDITGKDAMVDERLQKLAPHVRPARFTTFEADGAKKLARLFKLKAAKKAEE
jgi:hypothetical protein